MALAQDTREQIRQALFEDWPYWAANCAQIVNTSGRIIPLAPKPAQLRVWAALKAQRDAGRPMRVIVPKARKEGVSTMVQSLIVQRVTQRANHNAISVAHLGETAGELLQMATIMHANLPTSDEWQLKPPIANRSRKKELVFGNRDTGSLAIGDIGLNSRMQVDTAQEFEAGRGFTFHSVHGSECAFWPDLKRKLTALLNAVPDEPETLIALESTSNGHNHWRTLCMQALDGLNDFMIVFLPWFDEPAYARGFISDQEREEFVASIGTGPYGDEEPELVEVFGCTPEQLNWRRWAIANRCQGDLRTFHQEYPSTLEQSFLSSGKHVFPQEHVTRARREAEAADAPSMGMFEAGTHRTVRQRYGTVEVPEQPLWKDGPGDWELWRQPDPDAQYVVAVDPAGDDVMDPDERAMHGIVVIDHRTREQVAQMQAQGDADLIGIQAYLACLYFNRAWLAVETTGGWGLSMVRRVYRDFRYPFVYKRKSLQSGKENTEERLGWDSNRVSKVILEDGGREILREGTHGIRSLKLCRELTTYVKDAKGKSGPSPGERSDLVMAWLIAHQAAQELTIKTATGVQGGVVNTTTRSTYSQKMGY